MKDKKDKMHIMKHCERYPLELTKFKTDNYKPGDHYRIPQRWDNFTMHAPLWTEVLNHYFEDKSDLLFLELGSGNGLCANFLLDNYKCTLHTVDIEETRIVKEGEDEYEVSTLKNLQPFIDQGRCNFHHMNTKQYLSSHQDYQYDFIYVDASHDKDWVLYDAVNSFSLLKTEGLLIFDDYGWGDCALGIDAFTKCFEKHIHVIHRGWQIFLHKVSDL